MSKRPSIETTAKPAAVASIEVAPDRSGAEIPAAEFRRKLHAWYRKHARELPWRGVNDPYATWLSEIMLQQTRVATVIDRYREFLARFPTLHALAVAEENDVLALWSGLGYYRRARMLLRAAQFVERELDGRLPQTSAALRTLPGVGEYTAAAIASIAFGESIAVVDGNVERVLLRVMGLPEERSSRARTRIARMAQTLVPKPGARGNAPGDHNQAMMELGATLCLPRAPLCLQCPVFELCRTRGEHTTPAHEKQQSRIVGYLLAVRKAGTATEVLLERRAETASLMPGMLELPALPLDAVHGREPVLRVRHAITNTNYYAQIFSEGAVSAAAAQTSFFAGEDTAASRPSADDTEVVPAYDDVYVGPVEPAEAPQSLISAIPASAADLQWTRTSRLLDLPLTGLARKVLQRLGVMAVPQLWTG